MHRDHQAGEGSFCRSTWIATEPSNADHALDVYRMAILPRIEELDGFCSASMLIDRATGMAVGTVAFDSREALDASRTAAEGIRAGASNRDMVRGLGINIRLLYRIVFAAGVALAALAGMIAAPAASQSAAVRATSSGVVGSCGQSVFAVSAPVGATVMSSSSMRAP